MKSEFRSDLDTRLVCEIDGTYKLLAPLRYYSEMLGTEIAVPADFVTDFASVPRLPLAYLMVGGKGARAAVIHDWLYSGGNVWGHRLDRDLCDAVLAEALRASGYSWLTTDLMYFGVRIGGQSRYDQPNIPQEKHVEIWMTGEAFI